MAWKKAPKSTVQTFYELLPKSPFAEQRKIFGYPCCFVNGNLFAGVHQSDIILRLPENEREEFIRCYKSGLFKPFPNRTMREYVVVPKTLFKEKDELKTWFKKSFQYAASLPSKGKK